MSEVRIVPEEDMDAFVNIVADAYPGWGIVTPEDKERTKQRLLKARQDDPGAEFYGLYRGGTLLGTMRLHDFRLNFLGVRIDAGGVGLVAVHLMHKREHVAKEMMEFFLRHYRERGAPLVMLYPFRPDFYKQMGFGYGAKMSRYRFRPADLPRRSSKAHVRYLGKDDLPLLVAYDRRLVERIHGFIETPEHLLSRLLESPKVRVVGYEDEGGLQGYMVLSFQKGETDYLNDLRVEPLRYDDPRVLAEFLAFLHTQFDQIRHVILDTPDDFFHYLLHDPRDGAIDWIFELYQETNVQGVGLMYRVIDTPAIFRLLGARDFNGQTCRLRLTIADDFFPENDGSTLLHVENGHLRVVEQGKHDVEVRLAVADFSSLLAGAVDFRALYRLGLAEVSVPTYVEALDALFAVKDKPFCTDRF